MDRFLPGFLKKYRRNHQTADDRHWNDPGEKNKLLKRFRRKHNNADETRSRKNHKVNWIDLLANPVDLFNLLAFPVPPRPTPRTRTSVDYHSVRRRDVLEGHSPCDNWDDIVADTVPTQPKRVLKGHFPHDNYWIDFIAFPISTRPTSKIRTSLNQHSYGERIKVHARRANWVDLLANPVDLFNLLAFPVPPRATPRTRSPVDYHSTRRRDALNGHAPHDEILAAPVPTRPTPRTRTSVDYHSNGSDVKTGTNYERGVLPRGCRPPERTTTTPSVQPQYDVYASSSRRQTRPTVVKSESNSQSKCEARTTTTPPIQPQYDVSASSSRRQTRPTVVKFTNQSKYEARTTTTPSVQPQYDVSAFTYKRQAMQTRRIPECYWFGFESDSHKSESAAELKLQRKFNSNGYVGPIIPPYYSSSDDMDYYSDSSNSDGDNMPYFSHMFSTRNSPHPFRDHCDRNQSFQENQKITDIEKWLVNISIEPRFGCLIIKGYEMGFVYDTIVFTALCSSTGSIFYRGGDDEQKKESDLKNMTFSDSRGDAFTYLKIYKEWQQVPNWQKNEWCFDNSLNSKSLRSARELVNEICSIFKQNWSIEVKRKFSTEVELEEALQKIILFSFYENIAHSLGHIRMGYYIPKLQQRVFIHPSSALNSLNDSSQWLVFINILKTSKDYITVVTPVEESWIRSATRLKTNKFDIDEAKRRSVCSVRTQFFGSTTYSDFVGMAHEKLKVYEDLLYESVQVPVVIEADRQTGEVKFICGFNATLPDDLIDGWIAEAKSQVKQRSAEYKVGSNNQAGGVRIVLGLGGEGQLILMPDEYRSVNIKSWDKKTTKEMVEDKFNRFGKISDCWEDKRSYHRWGRVTFSTPEAAAEAVRRTQNDPKDAAEPEFKIRKHASYQYEATIEWLRRKPTGLVFVEMDYMEAMAVKSLREVKILGKSCGISLGKKNNGTVLLHKVPTMVTEQDIQMCFPNNLITKISIIREKTYTNPNELPYFRQQIYDQFHELDQDMKFVVDVMKPYDSNINFRAFIKFKDVSQGTMACDALRGRLSINGQKAQIIPKLSTSLSVPENVYKILEEEIEDFVAESKENGIEFKLDIKKLNNVRRLLNISASNSNDLVQIRMGLAAIIKGEVIECWRNENNRYLFMKPGRNFLRSLEKRTNTILQLDNRLLSLRVFGMEDNIYLAQSEIDQYLGNIAEGDGRREIKLDGETQPKGLMKTLVTRYDLELEGFVQTSGLQSALLNHRNQTLKICGDSASIEKATRLIESLAAELRNKKPTSESEELPDCCTCFGPVESMDHMYRLDACGHVYCLECIKRQITVSVQDKELPVLCGECQDPLVWSDFQFCFKRVEINPLDLVRTAVSVYMTKNKDGYRHCLTPDCPMVYRITKKTDLFNCNECGLRICTSCHIEYHDGLACRMLDNSIGDSEMEKYLKVNASTVKRCPKCSTPIEKKSGCDHMTCRACKTHFCWLCCEIFTKPRSTFGLHYRTYHV